VAGEVAAAQGARLPAFTRAIRRFEPGARVLLAAENGSIPEGFDGRVRPGDGVEVLRLERTSGEKNPAAKRLGTEEQTPSSGSHARAPVPAAQTDHTQALLHALAHGGEILPIAMAVIRERLGDADAQFAPGSSQGGAPVVGERGALGVLRSSPGVRNEDARREAAWLGAWLSAADSVRGLRQAATTDALTGARNRRFFDDHLRAAIAWGKEHRQPVSVMVFDIDDFKKYNDAFGHGAGDAILREMVRLLRSVVRPSDHVCRIGGDEFAVIFHDPQGPRREGSAPVASVFAVAERFQAQVRAHKFPRLAEGTPVRLTVSGGLATYPWDGSTPVELLTRADELALAGKRQGKNVIVLGPGGSS
jgi:diguanylate cyclase (GGDEF)-like protein